ncbi:MAG: trigger factor, partial [Planctomycetota bacterium]
MTERPEPSVELVDEGPCKKRLKTEVPAEAVAEELEESYRQLRSTIQLPGFRKGRVPRSVLERRFAGKIEEDVREEMIHSTFQKEMERRELRIVGSPTFDNVEFKRGEPLRYDAVFEVAPSFKLGDYRGLEIEEKPASVADEDVDRELESLREQYATLEPVPFGEQREEDVAVVEFSLVDGEEQCLSRPEVFLKIGSNRVDNIVVDGLTEGLLGASADEELRFAVQIPAEFPRDDLKGRSLELRLSLRELKRKRLPEVDEELARR